MRRVDRRLGGVAKTAQKAPARFRVKSRRRTASISLSEKPLLP